MSLHIHFHAENSMAEYDDFMKIDIRAGIVTRAELFPRARNPAYKV